MWGVISFVMHTLPFPVCIFFWSEKRTQFRETLFSFAKTFMCYELWLEESSQVILRIFANTSHDSDSGTSNESGTMEA